MNYVPNVFKKAVKLHVEAYAFRDCHIYMYPNNIHASNNIYIIMTVVTVCVGIDYTIII